MAGSAQVRITVSLPGEPAGDLVLDYPLDSRHGALLWEIHDHHGGEKVVECRMHDDDPKLTHLRGPDGRVRGIWLVVAHHPRDPRRLCLKHWPNSPAGPGSHDVPRPMTEEHIRGQEYVAERGRDFGHGVVCNRPFSTVNLCRADVLVSGSVATLAAEIQVSKIEAASVLARTRRAADAGATSVWFPRMENPPPWQFQVPSIATNEVPSLALGAHTWTVTRGVRALEDEKCAPRSRHDRCPLGKVAHCYGYHPLWVPAPVVSGARTVDEIVEKFPDGGFVRLDTRGRQGVILTTPADREKWLDFQQGLPRGRRSTTPPRAVKGGIRHPEYAAEKLSRRLGKAVQPGGAAPWCGDCRLALDATPHRLPPQFGSCSRCTGPAAREFLLADPRAGRSCRVCGEPLPRAAVHLTEHRDCEPAGAV